MKYENRNKGFTLIELIIVLMIMVILSSVGTVGVLQYMDYSMYNQNEEYARTIFSTTQTALTNLKKSEGLEGLQKELKSQLYKNSSVMSNGEENWYDTDHDKTVSDTDDSPRYYYLNSYFYSGTDNTISGTVTKPILQRLIKDYIYDNDIWNHALSVEIDPYDGVVRRVWYCKQTMEFTRTKDDIYKDDNEKGLVCMYIGTGKEPIDYNEQRNWKIGLYSADAKAMPADVAPTPSLVANSVSLVNDNELYLKWTMQTPTPEYSYIVTLNNVGSSNKVEITVPYSTIELLNTSSSGKYRGVPVDVKVGAATKPSYCLMQRIGDDIELVIDAMDYGEKTLITHDYTGDNKYNFTPSAMRFTKDSEGHLILGDLDISKKITASVAATDGTNTGTAVDSINSEYLLFGGDGSDYEIRNLRHFNNIRFADPEYQSSMSNATFKLTADLDWKDTETVIYDSVNKADEALHTSDFDYSPISLHKTQTLDGDNHTIANIRIAIKKDKDDQALVKQSDGEIIKNITLVDPVIRGSNYVACFVAHNYSKLENLVTQITDTSNTDIGVIGTGNYAGGIVASSGKGNLTDLSNSVPIKSNSYVGGIAGYAKEGNATNCSNTGTVSFIESPSNPMYLGGIAGYGNKIVFSGCSYTANNPTNIAQYFNGIANDDGSLQSTSGANVSAITSLLVGSDVGGLVGKAYDCNIREDNVVNTDFVLGSVRVGGIAGQFSRNDGENVEIQHLENHANVLGNKCVGGIVGANGTVNYDNNNVVDLTLNGDDKCKIYYCNNYGLVGVAGVMGCYVGGITGFNNGAVKACTTDHSAFAGRGLYYLTILKQLSSMGSHTVGGLIGYDNHRLDNTEYKTNYKSGGRDINPQVYAIVAANRNAGGIIGQSGEKSKDFKNIDLVGGYIYAYTECGGMIGEVGCKIKLTDNDSLLCTPDYIEGNSNVGGMFGKAANDKITDIYNLTLGKANTVIKASNRAAGIICENTSSVNINKATITFDKIETPTESGSFSTGLIGILNGKNFTLNNATININSITGRGGTYAVGGILSTSNISENFTIKNVEAHISSIFAHAVAGGIIGTDNNTNKTNYDIDNLSLTTNIANTDINSPTGAFSGKQISNIPIDLSNFRFTGNVYTGGQLTNKTIGNK